ncbi:MAG: hypothetical protein KDD45_03530 [Bdellovibrionales bacterium]|nr:hypothetical protein [Bdellovibrionales bacterium]
METINKSAPMLNIEPSYINDKFTWLTNIINDNQQSLEDKRFTNFLGQHSTAFFSPLIPCFLDQLKTIDIISYLSPFAVRDGILGIYNFYLNSVQTPLKPMLIYNQKIQNFIPSTWLKKSLFYSYKSIFNEDHIRDDSNFYIIYSLFGAKQASDNYISDLIQKIYKKKTLFKKIVILALTSEDFMNTVDSNKMINHGISTLITAIKALDIPIEVKSPHDFNFKLANKSYFVDFNEFSFYYSDSYLNHLFLSNGAIPFESLNSVNKDLGLEKIQLSFYHYLEISEFKPTKTNDFIDDELFKYTSLLNEGISSTKTISPYDKYENFYYHIISKSLS